MLSYTYKNKIKSLNYYIKKTLYIFTNPVHRNT